MNSLYVLFLENEKWLLHASTTTDKYYLFLECYLIYDFVKTNGPVNLFDTITITDNLEIDMYVKKYMRQYGIENVRGGSFANENLQSTTVTALERELSRDCHENPSIIQDICQKYEDIQDLNKSPMIWRTWRREYEFMDCPSSIQEFMILEKRYLKEEWTSFEEIKNMFHSLSYCSDIIQLDIHDFTQELEWLKMQISAESLDVEQIWTNNEDGIRYNLILSLLQHIKNKFLLIHENLPTYERDCFIKNPSLIFDTFIYHRKDIHKMEKERQIASEVFDTFEYMFNCVMNRLEEHKFALTQYPDNYENQIRYELEYIDYTYFCEQL